MTPSRQLRSFAARIRRRAERALYWTGRTVKCPYCSWTGWRFLSAGEDPRPNRLCPGCSSLERYRFLALMLQRELAGKRDIELLEIAPKACLKQFCRARSWGYLSSDLDSPDAMVHADLRSMPMEDNRFDVLVCFHVMEHIADDAPAFAEIGRLLKPDGFGLICVPLGGERTAEGAPSQDWHRLYGRYDHVRLYGLDIVERMRAAGLTVQTIDTLTYFDDAQLTRHGLRGDDRFVFLVRKKVIG